MIFNGIFLSRSSFIAGMVATTPFLYTPNEIPRQRTTICTNTEDYQASATYIRNRVSSYLDQDITLAGPFLRLAFHDATTFESGPTYLGTTGRKVTGGPNGSVRFELDRYENRALSRPLRIVEQVFSEMEESNSCRVSLADTIALAGAEAVEHAGGPNIKIRMGRPDSNVPDPSKLRVPVSRTSERSVVDRTLPSGGLDSVEMRRYFGRLGLSEAEFVALSGSHSLGRHVSLLGMPKACLKNLTRFCLEEAPILLPFIPSSVDRFSNEYFKSLLRYAREKGNGGGYFIPTDVALVVDDGLRQHVERFAREEQYFFRSYTIAYQKLVDTTANTSKLY